MDILVSGATGFVGSTITRHLVEEGHSVRAMSRSAKVAADAFGATETGRAALDQGRLTFAEADVTKPHTLDDVVQGVEGVVQAAQFHGAPVEDASRGLTYDAVDRAGTVNLLEAVARVYGRATAGPDLTRFAGNAPRFVYMSGISVSARPQTYWDRAKWQAEEAVRGSGLRWTIVRSCWVFGPGDTALNRIISYSDYLPFVPMFGAGKEPLTPIFVEDIGRFLALAFSRPDRSLDTTFGLGGPDLVTLPEFLRLALAVMGRKRPLLRVPKPVGKVQGAILQLFPGQMLSPGAVDFVSQAGVISREQRELLAERFPEFHPTPIREALESYLGGD
jgi:uncharacterized protein YbjT (DUF2867 family)